MSDTTRDEQTPPLVWTNALMFALTFAAAAILVPWYGLTRGFSPAAWAAFVLFAGANGMAITAGYHRLWAHRTYEAHWSLRLLYLVFGTMALQNSVFAWCSGHRAHHLHVDDVDRDPYSARRGFWFSHIGWMLRHYPSGRPDFANIPDLRRDPMLAFQHRYYVPLALATNIGLPVPRQLGTLLLRDRRRALGEPRERHVQARTVRTEHQSPGPLAHRYGRQRRHALRIDDSHGAVVLVGDVGPRRAGERRYERGHQRQRGRERGARGHRTHRDPRHRIGLTQVPQGRSILKNDLSPTSGARA